MAIEFVEIPNTDGDPDPYTVAVDRGTEGDVQLFKLAYAADGSTTLAPVSADGVLVDVGIAKAEDAGHTTGDKGIMALAVRQGSDGDEDRFTFTGTTGDYSAVAVDQYGTVQVAPANGGQLPVSVPSGVNITGNVNDGQVIDPDGVPLVPIAGIYEVSPTVLGDSEPGLVGITVDRQLKTSDAAAAAALAAIDGHVDALEGSASTIATNTGNEATSLAILDDWDESDRAKVNPIVGQAGVAAGAGAVAATVQRVTLASDDPGVASLSVLDDWDESDRAKVNPIVGQAGVAAGAGAVGATVQRMTHASDDPVTTALQLIDDIIVTDDTAASSPKGAVVAFIADDTSTDSVDEGDTGYARMTLTRMQVMTIRPDATGEGLTPIINLDIDESEDDIKTSPGKVYGWDLYNRATSDRFVRLYNATAANTTVGTTAARAFIPIPPGAKVHIMDPDGITFDTAICIAATTGFAANDTGAPATNDVMGTIYYQ